MVYNSQETRPLVSWSSRCQHSCRYVAYSAPSVPSWRPHSLWWKTKGPHSVSPVAVDSFKGIGEAISVSHGREVTRREISHCPTPITTQAAVVTTGPWSSWPPRDEREDEEEINMTHTTHPERFGFWPGVYPGDGLAAGVFNLENTASLGAWL